jgi:molecular chaperone IbpA
MEDLDMRTNYLDLAPFRRATVGFDRLFDFMNNTRFDNGNGYPPFDIEKHGEDRYQIRLALAGFTPEEVELVVQENDLTIRGHKEQKRDGSEQYLHRGIAAGSFERRFQLADYVQVESAELVNGVLSISLKREVPESKKPRRIEIAGGHRAVEHQPEREKETA